eukprot:11419633-Heterocapsa_arctica.AAC.1
MAKGGGTEGRGAVGGKFNAEFRILVQTIQRRTRTMKVRPSDYVVELKELIYDKTGLPGKYQVLIHRGQVLRDEEHLEEHQVRQGSTIR